MLHSSSAGCPSDSVVEDKPHDSHRILERYPPTANTHYNAHYFRHCSHEYKLLLGNYNGTSGDTLSHVTGLSFSTSDNDNDISLSRVNCAEVYGGGWWLRDSACGLSNLNGRYLAGKHFEGAKQGVYWHYFRGDKYSLKFSEMNIRGEDY